MSDENANKNSLEEIISVPSFLGDNDLVGEISSEELISVPSFLTRNYGISPTACSACEYWLCTGCEAEQGDPCGSGEWCSECTCQGWECSECGSCENSSQCGSCQNSSQCSCQSGCMDCLGEAGDGCLCSGGQGQYPCSQSCSECSGCEGCMDCENSCQNSIQSAIDKWDWFENAETTAAYRAITENGLVRDFSHNVWNDLVNRVYDVRGLAGINPRWDDTYASYYSTRMSAADKTLTAVRFNSLWRNINYLWSTGITARSKGDVVYGSYFTSLTTALNNYISYL